MVTPSSRPIIQGLNKYVCICFVNDRVLRMFPPIVLRSLPWCQRLANLSPFRGTCTTLAFQILSDSWDLPPRYATRWRSCSCCLPTKYQTLRCHGLQLVGDYATIVSALILTLRTQEFSRTSFSGLGCFVCERFARQSPGSRFVSTSRKCPGFTFR